jgi:hypothetical protein
VSFASVAALLRPAGRGISFEVIDASEAWIAPKGRAANVVVWGRAPAPSGTPLRAAIAHASRRGRARLALRGSQWTSWPPPDLGGDAARNRIRTLLLAGAIVEIGKGGERVLDAAAAAAGAGGRVERFRPASAGSLLARIQVGGAAALLRIAPAGSPGDPSNAADALSALAGTTRVPGLVARGQTHGAQWLAETRLPGTRPRRVTEKMWDSCVELCSALPHGGIPAAPTEDFDALADALPEARAELDRARAAATALLSGLGAAARHGDLWRPNLLAGRGKLTGIVDWDAWHPAAAPGTDLLNLFATERHGPGLGRAWSHAPWRSAEFRQATRAYWESRHAVPGEREMEGVAVAWWAGQAAASLRRLPHLAQRTAWVEANVWPVLRSL